MKPTIYPVLTVAAVCGVLTCTAFGQQAAVFASGLLNPAKIILGPSGGLLAAEVGRTSNSGRVSVISSSGVRTTLIDGLPSGLSTPNNDPDGVNGLLLDGNTLYIAIGEGDLYAPGPAPGTTIVRAGAISSPIFDTLLRVDLPESVDRITTPFTLAAADHTALFNGNPVTLTNSSGEKATVSVLTEFRFRPDAVEIIKHSHPYGLAKLDSDPNHLYVNDAGLNLVHQIDVTTGRKRTLVQFPQVPNLGSTPPPVVDAVPDNIRAYGDQLLVTFLTGFPFTPGDSRVMRVDPQTGATTPFIFGLSSAIDIAYRARPNGERPQFFVLEYSAGLAANQPGRVQVFNSPTGQILASGINGASSLALDTTNNKLYIASRTDGTILEMDIGQ
jgi:hypothetical protein